jgi:hypothetical protein
MNRIGAFCRIAWLVISAMIGILATATSSGSLWRSQRPL